MPRGAVPEDPLAFITRCFLERKVLWTYHVNVRAWQRKIPTAAILRSVESFEIIEEYPEDKYLPSYLVRAEHAGFAFHLHVAADVQGDNVRVVTVYLPDPAKWEPGFRLRRAR